ncbi:Na/Pi cotransporter family protein [Psychromonas sp.]|nr:Na/Pi cotransporter family protein [Psychromonas sp.]
MKLKQDFAVDSFSYPICVQYRGFDVLKKLLLPSIFIILAYGFWQSSDFKTIAAGVAIFLFGMISLEEGFKAFTGGSLEKILNVSTNTQFKSIGFGVLTTSIMQSSSLVSVITISFLSAGLLELAAGIGIIFGANIGTTTGAWLVAGLGLKVKISAYAMPMLVFGVIMVLQKNKHLRGLGYILTGLGFLFLGISYMKEGFEAFKGNLDLANYAMTGYKGLFVFAFIGVAATVIMQSSHATLVLIITALAAHQISYENALALAIGANVGTTVTAVLGAMSANIEGKRLAGAHFIFNMVTGLIAIVFIQQFLVLVDWTSEHVGIADDNYTLKLAVFHTLFNLTGVLIMWPFINRLVLFLEKYLPGSKQETEGALYLNSASLDFPETALEAIRNETLHIYDISLKVLCEGLSLNLQQVRSKMSLSELVQRSRKVTEFDIDKFYELKVKGLYSEIIDFISHASFTWEMLQSEHIHWLRSANQNIIEAIKDMKHLRKNMSKYMLSTNIEQQGQYDLIRLQIALVIREIESIRSALKSDQSPDVLLLLNALKVEVVESDKTIKMNISRLLQRKSITPFMASSLLNDCHYGVRISNNLISMASTLYTDYDRERLNIEREVALDNEEIEELAH